MVVVRLSKKKKNFYYINAIYRKKSVFGKIIKRIGYCDLNINYGKKFYVDYELLLFYINKGAKMSISLFNILKK